MIRTQVKQLNETIEKGFNAAGHPAEDARMRSAKIEVLGAFLPQPLSEEAVGALVAEAIAETGAIHEGYGARHGLGERARGRARRRARGRREGQGGAGRWKLAL